MVSTLSNKITTGFASAAPATSKAVAQTAISPAFGNTKAKKLAKVTGHYGNILIQHEKALKYMTAIVASFLLVLSRVFTAWKTALTAEDNGEDKKFATKEAYRTTLREFGGFTFSYALLKSVEKKTTKYLLDKVGLDLKSEPQEPHVKVYGRPLPSIKQATKQFVGNVKKVFKNSAITEEVAPSKIYRQDAGPDLKDGNYKNFAARYNRSNLFRRWVNLFQPSTWRKQGLNSKTRLGANLLAQGKTPLELFKPYLKNSPMLIGGLTALGLSGFFLEWLTINKMDTITGWLSGHQGDDPVTPYQLPEAYQPKSFTPGASALALPNNALRASIPHHATAAQDMFNKFSQPY
jgi:hypothetical protein